ncbi:YppG family protein [Heyndrickxia shackletonii]|uniref:YppG family protein n=1 Tax=Heyndrickxia shackletonii TaxID=157838 RepID=UPI0009F9EBD1|nr:YppG family protein [Heyndrickxia shackletonii]NEY99883.1 hypothetical protein [Heyndrickxia shackletonii]
MNGYNSYRSPSVPDSSYRKNIPSQTMFNQTNFPNAPFPHQMHQPNLYPVQQFPNGFQAYGGYNQVPVYNPQANEYPIQQQLFQNPLQPVNQNEVLNSYKPYSNPYPKSHYNAKPPASGMNSIMNSFKSQDGSIDFNKMVNTAGQMMNAVTQVSTMVKGLGGLFKP